MPPTYSCTYPGCDKVFMKPFELKKHKAIHETPDCVFYCPQCEFFTLRKKNLQIHIATHTSEKTQCSDMLNSVDPSGLPAREERCEYRADDPASLTKRQKKFHGYIPPLSRSRPRNGTAALRKFQRKKDRQGLSLPSSQGLLSDSFVILSRVPDKIDNDSDTSSVATCSFLSTASSECTFTSFPDVCGQSTTSNPTLFAPEEKWV